MRSEGDNDVQQCVATSAVRWYTTRPRREAMAWKKLSTGFLAPDPDMESRLSAAFSREWELRTLKALPLEEGRR